MKTTKEFEAIVKALEAGVEVTIYPNPRNGEIEITSRDIPNKYIAEFTSLKKLDFPHVFASTVNSHTNNIKRRIAALPSDEEMQNDFQYSY